MNEIFKNYGIEIKLPENTNFTDFKERTKDAFHVVKETLTRIGIVSNKTKTLYQSVHILHKRALFAILHFKELFLLDGKDANLTDEDILRRNAIAILLQEWKLLEIIEKEKTAEFMPLSQIRVISYKDKSNWILSPKYSIGINH